MPRYDCGPGDALNVIAEECSEVIKERMKVLRFGPEGTPQWRVDGNASPHELMVKELGDLLVAIEVAIDNGQINIDLLMKARNDGYVKMLERFGLTEPQEKFYLGIGNFT